ncbi:MAG: lysophospholipid acyltransferase family protein [Bacteroidales bacterium]|nr:lysophospholipid acyltransferase family protein [Bacteroidales bacterium]
MKKTKTKIINKSDIMKAIHMRGLIGWILSSLAMWVFGFNKVNKANDRCKQYQGADFSAHILKDAGVSYDLKPQQYNYIPQDGPFIVVANHPIGSADGMMLSAVIGTMRTDFKIMANFLLTMIPSLKDSFIAVNPFTDGGLAGARSSLAGIRIAKEHLAAGGSLGLFPAGEVSTYQRPKNRTSLKRHVVEDIPWPTSMIKLIRNANVPVIPVYFEAQNSKWFHFVGRIHPMLRTLNLPNELFNKKGKTIPMRIGKPIMPNELAEYPDIEQLGGYLRSRVYAMESEFNNVNEELMNPPELVTPISLPRDKKAVVKEFDRLKNGGKKLFEVSNYQCYLADSDEIPVAMIELGRRREEAFRATGEGSNQAIDVDDYDKYYKQLILWDAKRKRIAGGYRLGIGTEIFEKHGGIEGFYTSSLFTYDPSFETTLHSTIELGRSFVSLEYQKEALPLMLLLKGLMHSLMRYPDAEYFIGPVSISNAYPKFYQSLMVYYLENKYSAMLSENAAQPTTPFEPDYLKINPKDLLRRKMDNFEKFDRFLMRLSDNTYRMPTLVKKYMKVNTRIIAFNVDPLFNYSLDGLIILRIKDYPRAEILSMTKDVENPAEREAIMNRFGYSLKD